MADQTVFQVKRSNVKNAPIAGNLEAGELAYSFASGKTFIGVSDANSEPMIIGGKAYTDLFDSHIGVDGTVTYGVAQENQAVVLGTDKTLDTIDIGTLKLNGDTLTTTANSLNILTGFTDVVTDNTLASVADTTLVSSKAIKEYVYERTQAAVSTFEFTDAAEHQMLIANATGVFENKELTGVVQLFSDGSTDVRDSQIVNRMVANNTIENAKLVNNTVTLGTEEVALGGSIVLNRNNDLVGTMNVSNGGTGTTTHESTGIIIGDGTNAVRSSANFTYDIDTQAFAVTGDSTMTGNTTVTGSSTVEGAVVANSTLAVVGTSDLTGAVTASSTLDVTGATTLSDTLAVTGASTLTGAVSASSTLDVTGAATFQNTATVAGDLTAQSNVDVTGNATVGGTLDVTGAATASSTLDVTGATTLADTLLVQGTAQFQENVTFDKDVTVTGDLFVNGNNVVIETQTLTVEDNIVKIAANNDQDATDVGVTFQYSQDSGVSSLYAGFFRDHTSEKFLFYKDYGTDPGLTMTGIDEETMLGTIRAHIDAPSVAIASGTIDNVVITNSVIDAGEF